MKKKPPHPFGARLRAVREAASLTQTQLASLVGMEPPNISRLEAGRVCPSWDTVCLLADALQISTESFREKSPKKSAEFP